MENVIATKWTEVKSEVMKAWDQISQAEVEGTNGNLQDLISLVQKKLGVAREEAATKLMELAAIIEGDQSLASADKSSDSVSEKAESTKEPTKH